MLSRATLFIICLAVFAAAGCNNFQPPRQVVFITIDTTRADHFGCYGNDAMKTPNMDAFAKDAVLFKNAFTVVNSTAPSHTSLFTSNYIRDHGVISNTSVLPDYKGFLPKLFRSAGYETAAFTSASVLVPKINMDQGFDMFDYPERNQRIAANTNKKVFEWLDRNDDDDFFLWVHYYDPHMLYEPPPPYNTMYNYTSDERLSKIKSPNLQRLYGLFQDYIEQSDDPEHFRNLYKGEVSYLDHQLGELFGKLKEVGIYDNSIIVIVADHGESLGEKGIYYSHGGINDTNVKVPLLIKVPGNTLTGRRDQMVSSIDIYPTVLDLSDLDCPDGISGIDLKGIMKNPDAPGIRDEVYYETVYENYLGLKTRDYTYIRNFHWRDYDNPRPDEAPFEKPKWGSKLYNNITDPDHENNLNGLELKTAAEFDEKALAFMKGGAGLRHNASLVKDTEHIKKLKALGYVQ